ncbi:TerB family tellurite resistance protein [Rubellimicrobium arenae]|uniref:TerB family tellurite resistance protein n=1 Tax=Rubellimicrobium arenae TaxID=2817372 RepID=UPI001B30E8DA|nr:TerB family tellurite resistance protein [Rubellimicrobium arenae]
MGLFGKLTEKLTGAAGKLSGKSDLLEAICAACALVAAADGEVEKAELAATADALASHDVLGKAFPPSKIEQVAETMFKRASGGSFGRTKLWNEVEEAKAKSSGEDLELALAIVVDVARSDGQIEDKERPVLDRIARSWGTSLQAALAA